MKKLAKIKWFDPSFLEIPASILGFGSSKSPILFNDNIYFENLSNPNLWISLDLR